MGTLSGRLTGFLSSDKGRRAIIIGGIAVILLLFLSTLTPKEKSSSDSFIETTNAEETEQALERRLTAVLSQIQGAGEVTVMITLDSTAERIYAEDRKETGSETDGENLSQTSGIETETVLAGSAKEPLERSVIMPKVRGAAVVCSGASDPLIKEKVANAAASVLGIGISRVYVTC